MLKFAANLAMLFREYPLVERFRASRDFGFHMVEIPFPYELQPEQIKQELDSCGQSLWLIDLPVGDFVAGDRGYACNPGKSGEFRNSLDEALHYARILEVENLTCLVGKRMPEYSYNTQWSTLVENLRYASRRLEESGRTLLVEMLNNHESPEYFLPQSEVAARLVQEVNCSNCMMQYDLYHMQLMEGNLVQTIEKLLNLIGHIQIANVPGRHQPGLGEIDYSYVFSELERLNYQGVIGLEYIPDGGTVESLGWLKEMGNNARY